MGASLPVASPTEQPERGTEQPDGGGNRHDLYLDSDRIQWQSTGRVGDRGIVAGYVESAFPAVHVC